METSNPPQSVRAFFAAHLPASLRARVLVELERIRTALPPDAVRWTRPEQIHLTLKFFGNVPAAEIPSLRAALHQAADGIEAFELSIERLGCFPSLESPRVLWFGLGGGLRELQGLRQKIETACRGFGNSEEERTFHPHLTLGRVKAQGAASRRVGKALREIHVESLGSGPVDKLELIQSELGAQGSQYTCLELVRLHSNSSPP